MENESKYMSGSIDSTKSDIEQSSYYQEAGEISIQKVEIDEAEYTLNKPRRIILRARIIND